MGPDLCSSAGCQQADEATNCTGLHNNPHLKQSCIHTLRSFDFRLWRLTLISALLAFMIKCLFQHAYVNVTAVLVWTLKMMMVLWGDGARGLFSAVAAAKRAARAPGSIPAGLASARRQRLDRVYSLLIPSNWSHDTMNLDPAAPFMSRRLDLDLEAGPDPRACLFQDRSCCSL